MPFTDPNLAQNPVSGVAIATAWGDQVNTDLNALYGPARCRVRRSTTQTIINNSLTRLDFDLENIDTHTMHDLVTNNGRITVPTGWAGDWLIGGIIFWATSTAGSRRHAEIMLNETVKLADTDTPATSSGWATQAVSTVYSAIVGDYFTLHAFHDIGANLNVLNDGNAGTMLWAVFLGSGAG